MPSNFYNRGVGEPVKDDKPFEDRRGSLPDNLSGLSLLPDGSWHEVHRPLATGVGAKPYLGAEGHGTDDADDGLYYPHEDGDVAPMQDAPGENGKPDFQDIRWDGIPLFVAEVPHPMRAVVRNALTRTVYDGREAYGPTFRNVPDPGSVVSLPREPGRDRVHVSLELNYGTVTPRFAVAVSHDSSFPAGAYLVLSQPGSKHTFVTTEPLFFAVVPYADYDGSLNNTRLHVVQEFSTTIDRNSSQS